MISSSPDRGRGVVLERLNDCVSLLAKECPLLGLDATDTAEVRARGVDATIVYRPDRDEDKRRRDVGLGGVTRLDQLDLLMELPIGMPVPMASLRPSRRRMVRLPVGCVDLTADGVVRRIIISFIPWSDHDFRTRHDSGQADLEYWLPRTRIYGS